MLQKIKAGIGTYVGIGVGVLSLVPAAANQIISYIENNQAQLSHGEKMAFISGISLVAVTVAGRMAQAVAAIIRKPSAINSVGVAPPTGKLSPVDQARELLSENPGLIQQLKNEGTIT